jgi:hypothetical protein
MPITSSTDPSRNLITTRLKGLVTDGELIDHYRAVIEQYERMHPAFELVDGTGVEQMALTPAGLATLAALVQARADRLRHVRCAMVAPSDVVYGMFRMWEISREHLGYELAVFRDEAAARRWLFRPEEASPA